jgi:hypothetical protein
MNGADEGAFQLLEGVAGAIAFFSCQVGVLAGAVEFLAKAQFHFTGGGVGEGDSDDAVDVAALNDGVDDAIDEFARFAGAGGGFDNAITGCSLDVRAGGDHFMLLSSRKDLSSGVDLRPALSSS